MLLPFVLFIVLANVIANFYCNVVADVIAKWQMLWPLQGGWWYCGWCYYHRADGIDMGQYFTLVLVLRCYQEPHPIYVVDGICQHFCLGMDCWPLYMVCWWHLCHHQQGPKRRVPGPHQFSGQQHSVHSRGSRTWWIITFPGHSHYSRWRRQIGNISI